MSEELSEADVIRNILAIAAIPFDIVEHGHDVWSLHLSTLGWRIGFRGESLITPVAQLKALLQDVGQEALMGCRCLDEEDV